MPCFSLTQLHLQLGAAQSQSSAVDHRVAPQGQMRLSAYIKGSLMVVVKGGQKTILIHFPCSDFPHWSGI